MGQGRNRPPRSCDGDARRIWHETDMRTVGMISTYRHDRNKEKDLKFDFEAFYKHNRELYAALKRLKLELWITNLVAYGIADCGVIPLDSFFVAWPNTTDDEGQLEKILRYLGRRFEQDAIFIKNYGRDGEIVGTSRARESFPGYGVRKSIRSLYVSSSADAFERYLSRFEGLKRIDMDDDEAIRRINVPRTVEFIDTYMPETGMGRWALSAMGAEVLGPEFKDPALRNKSMIQIIDILEEKYSRSVA